VPLCVHEDARARLRKAAGPRGSNPRHNGTSSALWSASVGRRIPDASPGGDSYEARIKREGTDVDVRSPSDDGRQAFITEKALYEVEAIGFVVPVTPTPWLRSRYASVPPSRVTPLAGGGSCPARSNSNQYRTRSGRSSSTCQACYDGDRAQDRQVMPAIVLGISGIYG